MNKTITDYLFWKEAVEFSEPQPKNSALNIILNVDRKGCAKLCKLVKGSNSNILDNIVNTWGKKMDLQLNNFDLSTSFNLHHGCYKNTYLQYIQFRTLHKRFFTNEKLFKMGIKNSPMCALCNIEEDSVEHILIECTVLIELWKEVRSWIVELGVPDYNLTESKIVIGELEKSICINSSFLQRK